MSFRRIWHKEKKYVKEYKNTRIQEYKNTRIQEYKNTRILSLLYKLLHIIYIIPFLSITSYIKAADDFYISDLTLNVVKRFENFSMTTYLDSGDKPTIGYGHLITEGDEINPGSLLTKQQGEILLRKDIKERANISSCLSHFLRDSLNDAQYAALTSLCFNIGPVRFKGSTVLKRVNDSDFEGAYEYFGNWRRVGGSEGPIIPGLVKRRFTEMFLFADQSLDPSDDTIPSEQWGLPPMPITDENWQLISIEQKEEAVNVYNELIS